MKEEFYNELDPAVREKTKKNLVYVSILSIVMLFGGLTSAYIVSMGGAFWVKFPLPSAFWISTTLIALSSITLVAAIYFAKKNNQGMLKTLIVCTLALGLGFVYFQFKGYGQLIDKGAYFASNHILVSDGRYGDFFTLNYEGKDLIIDGNNYYLGGKICTPEQKKAISEFATDFIEADKKGLKDVKDYGSKFNLTFKGEALSLNGSELVKPNGEKLEYTDLNRLSYFAYHLKDGRGDFYLKGELGKDFKILYQGEELGYESRTLHLNGKPLEKYLQIKALESADTGTSYLYILTFLHLLHIAVAVIYLMRMVVKTFKGKFSSENTLSLRLGGIFWHFLGLLWIFLLLFLLFIH